MPLSDVNTPHGAFPTPSNAGINTHTIHVSDTDTKDGETDANEPIHVSDIDLNISAGGADSVAASTAVPPAKSTADRSLKSFQSVPPSSAATHSPLRQRSSQPRLLAVASSSSPVQADPAGRVMSFRHSSGGSLSTTCERGARPLTASEGGVSVRIPGDGDVAITRSGPGPVSLAWGCEEGEEEATVDEVERLSSASEGGVLKAILESRRADNLRYVNLADACLQLTD